MAVETRRGCGYRKVGGIYLVCDGAGFRCDQLPVNLEVIPDSWERTIKRLKNAN